VYCRRKNTGKDTGGWKGCYIGVRNCNATIDCLLVLALPQLPLIDIRTNGCFRPHLNSEGTKFNRPWLPSEASSLPILSLSESIQLLQTNWFQMLETVATDLWRKWGYYRREQFNLTVDFFLSGSSMEGNRG
jgi:hypothetical protein